MLNAGTTKVDKSFLTDPWPTYRRIAGDGPVQHVSYADGTKVWLITGYEAARTLLDDPRVSKDIRALRKALPDKLSLPMRLSLNEHMLNTDPPDHTRLRRLVNKAFTPRNVVRMRATVERVADAMADAMGDAGEVDLIDAFAFPLPIAVISELLAVPHEDRSRMRDWSRAFVSEVPTAVLERASREFTAYLSELIDRKRAALGTDLLSELVRASEEGDQLSMQEVINMAYLLLIAGHETTVSLISNAVYSLLTHPAELAKLRADPKLLPGAVEEVLRYESPIHMATLRFTVAPVTIGGVTIPPGEFLHISLPAANRDAAKFREPDTFDINRDARGHIAFGHGIHFCVGAPLARLEGEIALRTLLGRFSKLELAATGPELRWRSSVLVHTLRTLPVRYAS